jgi:MFS transporter, MHS family, citrate/tricarballylate:H+ symporter
VSVPKPVTAQTDRRARIKAVFRVATGNFLEMYDFTVFGYYAAPIGRTFFPKSSEFASLMLAFVTFGVGFLIRPLGALVLGAYIDRRGRRAGLILTFGLMSLGTLSIACVPGYAVMGLAAPLLVVAGRLLQGFSAGVELGSVSVYLSEIATPGHKGFYVSWQNASQQCAVVFAALFGVILSSSLTCAQVDSWGWRLPLLVGCAIIPFLFMMRRSLAETGEFLSRRRPSSTREVWRSLIVNWRILGLATMLIALSTSCFYLITAYTPTFGRTVLHLADIDNLLVTVCTGVSNFLWLPVMGALSDRVGRRPMLFACTILVLATAYPTLLWLTTAASFVRLLCAELWLSFLYASYNGAMVVYLTELIPAGVRASGFSIAQSIAAAVFGGFTPAICTYLIQRTGNPASPGLWLSFTAAIALAATLMCRGLQPAPLDAQIVSQP